MSRANLSFYPLFPNIGHARRGPLARVRRLLPAEFAHAIVRAVVRIAVRGDGLSAASPRRRLGLGLCEGWPAAVGSDSVALVNADSFKAMYRRWLLEVWGAGRHAIVDELLHVDLVDRNRIDGQPDGRAGDVWAAQMVCRAFPDLRFVPDLVMSDGEFVVRRWTMTGTNAGTRGRLHARPTRALLAYAALVARSDSGPSRIQSRAVAINGHDTVKDGLNHENT